MRNLLFILFCIAFISPFISNAQTDPPKVIPLSPNAAEFAKYGNIPVNSSTGVPGISLPIYEINTGKIKVPISLTYHASGIQVSQRASWAGLGWSLNAGGIISRSVRGLPDETPNGWFNNPGVTQNIANTTDVNQLLNYSNNSIDTHPDFFSYSTPELSGRFIYSQAGSAFKSIPAEPVTISRLTGGGSNVDNTYHITGADGTHYYYQNKEDYFNDGDGSILTNRYTQSWYLSRIVSADAKDTVQFNYVNSTSVGGTNEESTVTETHTYTTGEDNMQYQDQGITSGQGFSYHTYVALSEIIFRNGKVSFYANTPRRDFSGGMLDSIVVYRKEVNNSYSSIYKYQFNHDYFTTAQPLNDHLDYRLRLLSMSKVSVIPGGEPETHQFIYNSIPLPSINSTGADYWGFYNGTPATNGLLPNVTPDAPGLELFKASNQRIGSGNRDSDPAFMQAGILQKIIYPTKGYTVFNYEPHQYTSDQQNVVTATISSVVTRGNGLHHPVTTTTNIVWPADVTANQGTVNLTFSAYNQGAFDYSQLAVLKDITAGTNMGIWEHPGNNATAYNVSATFTFDPSHSYQIVLTVDDVSSTNISFTVTGQRNVTSTITKNGAGLRIANIQNFSSYNELLGTDRYQYFGIDIGKNDVAIANNYRTIIYKKYPTGTPVPCGLNPAIINSIVYTGTIGYSGQNFEGANVLYNEIRKTSLDGNGNANGQTISLFNTSRAFSSIYNPGMPGGREFIDNSLGRTSLPIAEASYRGNTDGSFTLLKNTEYTYGNAGIYSPEPCLQVSQKYQDLPATLNCYVAGDFTKFPYEVICGATKLASVKESDYTIPSIPVITTTQYDYDNPLHLQVSRITKTGSDNKVIVTQNKYPADYSDGTYGSDLLRSQSINNSIVEQTVTKNAVLVNKTATAYKNSGGSIVPDYAMKALTNGTMETRIKFNSYDSNGNLLEFSNFGGVGNEQKTSYRWGYNYQYPVAEIKNAGSTEFYNEGFESGAVSGGTAGNAHTGNFYFNGTYTVNWTIPNSRNYTISYWYRTNGIWIRSASNAYTSNSFTLTGGDAYDDVSIYPSDAQLSAYTYYPLVGMGSATDAKGMTTYYEYDGLQRLKNVKDQNNNIVRHTDYHYKP